MGLATLQPDKDIPGTKGGKMKSLEEITASLDSLLVQLDALRIDEDDEDRHLALSEAFDCLDYGADLMHQVLNEGG